MKRKLKKMKVSCPSSTVQSSVINIKSSTVDQYVHLDPFESGLFEEEPEPSQSSIHPILEHHHEASTSTPSTSNAATVDSTSPTSNAATVDSTGPPSEVETDVEEFVRRTCGCTKANGKPCITLFSVEHYLEHRLQASLLTRKDLDLVCLGSIMTTVLDCDSIVDGRYKPAKRRRVSSCHMHHGFIVCKTTYAFLYNIGTKHRFENIKKHYLEHRMDNMVHKNSRQLPTRTLSFAQKSSLVKFIENYAEQNAILLSGRIPGYKVGDLNYYHLAQTKRYMDIFI